MLHELPITNIRLQACAVSSDKLTRVANGHFCADCQRIVHDFTQATLFDLQAAQAAAPDGRLCGQFRREQLAPQLRLRPKLRWFLVALVLVMWQGLSAQEAWAQVRQKPASVAVSPLTDVDTTGLNDTKPKQTDVTLSEQRAYGYVEQMPRFKGGVEGLMRYLRQNLRYPATHVEGRVFVRFIITKAGLVRNAYVAQKLDPLLDAEALRVIKAMPAWEPGKQNGLPVDVQYTFPITFRRETEPARPKQH